MNLYTYFKLKEGVDYPLFVEKMEDNFIKKIEPQVEQMLGVTLGEFKEQGDSFEYTVRPVTDVHLYSHSVEEIEQNGNVVYIYICIHRNCLHGHPYCRH